MSEPDVEHRLLAILAADMAAYSKLMSLDERATLTALESARSVFKATIQVHRGRVIDMAGDSVLAVFTAAQNAVAAALDLQRELKFIADRMPADRQARYRIGVHLGDVIEKPDGTVYGEGVNIAARLQTKAAAGGICLSQSVYELVKSKVPMHVQFAGRESFKNIAEPIPVWLITPDGRSKVLSKRWLPTYVLVIVAVLIAAAGWYAMHREPASAPIAAPATAESKSLAVLPFVNMSDDKEMAYFADGVHEDLLTQLALLRDLKVVSRTSVMEYRNSGKNARQIAGELGVASLLEGSVRRAGNKVRVNAQLIDARSDQHLWARSYDRELKDIFTIQTELASEISRALQVSLAPQEQTRLAKRPTDNLEAYDLLLRHQELVNSVAGTLRRVSTINERVALLSKAVTLDPKFAVAWAKLAAEEARLYGYDMDRTPARRAKAKEAIDRALVLAPDDPQVKIEAAAYYLNALDDYAGAEKAYLEVLQSAPNNIDALVGLSEVYSNERRPAALVSLLERALTVDARNMDALGRLAWTYTNYRHYDRALAIRKRMITIRPGELASHARYYKLEYLQTGSWDPYDKWRGAIPADSYLKSYHVWSGDIDRAIARRDFDGALRLADATTAEDLRGAWDEQDEAVRPLARAALLNAKGQRSQAQETVRMAMPRIEALIRKFPESESSWLWKALGHALMGERRAALAAQEKALSLAKSTGGSGIFAQHWLVEILALLGDREAALSGLSRLLKQPGTYPHAERVNPAFAALWDDPKFQAIVNDPTNNGPLSFDLKH